MKSPAPILWTNDDIKAGKSANLQRMIDFLDRFDVPGSFFVIPLAGGPISEDQDLRRVIDKARERGHRFYPHGLHHKPFECGVPPTYSLARNEREALQYDMQRLEIEAMHSFPAQVAMLEAGRAQWRQAFGEEPTGFRPPWASICTQLYAALEALGFAWTSGRVHGLAWVDRTAGELDAPPRYYEGPSTRPHQVGKIWEYPMVADYALNIADDEKHIDAMVDLALQDYTAYRQWAIPMNICTHWFALEYAGGTGYRIHEKLLPRMLDVADTTFLNMDDMHTWWTQAQAATVA